MANQASKFGSRWCPGCHAVYGGRRDAKACLRSHQVAGWKWGPRDSPARFDTPAGLVPHFAPTPPIFPTQPPVVVASHRGDGLSGGMTPLCGRQESTEVIANQGLASTCLRCEEVYANSPRLSRRARAAAKSAASYDGAWKEDDLG